jgi:hypothetical protein
MEAYAALQQNSQTLQQNSQNRYTYRPSQQLLPNTVADQCIQTQYIITNTFITLESQELLEMAAMCL